MGDIYNCDVLSSELKKRIGNQKIIAKKMTTGSDSGFFQEVAIMTLFIGHENFVTSITSNSLTCIGSIGGLSRKCKTSFYATLSYGFI